MCKLNKKKIAFQINAISQDILDNVISPACDIPKGIWADPFLTDITIYLGHTDNEYPEEQQIQTILKTICERYGIASLSPDGPHAVIKLGDETIEYNKFISPIDSYWTLASIALYIILYGKCSDFYMIEECDFCGKHGSLICGPYDNLICLNCKDDFIKGELK